MSLVEKLEKLFSSRTIIRKKRDGQLKIIDINQIASGGAVETNFAADRFNRIHRTKYGQGTSNLEHLDNLRAQLFADYENMDKDAIISSALDIYADEITARGERNSMIKIKTKDQAISETLYNLFYEILNIDYNLWPWVRSMCKYGDCFLKLDLVDNYGVVQVKPLNVYDVSRSEQFNEKTQKIETNFYYNPNSKTISNNSNVFFKASSHFNNEVFERNRDRNKPFKIYEIAHFRLLNETDFLPYGKSLIEGCRRVWKQIYLMEDAMMIHRVMRAPQKRVFRIDVGNLPPSEIDSYMQSIINQSKKTPHIDPNTGDYDLSFNINSVVEDFYLPTRGGESGTVIETLDSLEFNAVDDLLYLKNKLLAGLKIPRAFLTYEENIPGKAALAIEDVRFAKTVERIQNFVISELKKIAIIHLKLKNFSDEDLLNFEIELSNPSTVYEQEKIQILMSRLDLSDRMIQSRLFSTDYVYKNIFQLTDREIAKLKEEIVQDAKNNFRFEQIVAQGNDPAISGEKIDYEKNKSDLKRLKNELEELEKRGKMIRDRQSISDYGTDDHVLGKNPLGAEIFRNDLKVQDSVEPSNLDKFLKEEFIEKLDSELKDLVSSIEKGNLKQYLYNKQNRSELENDKTQKI